jgi:hypothetical protein
MKPQTAATAPPIALALFAWPNKRAWFLLALACVPQNYFFYDQLLVLLVAETRIELLFLCLCSWPAFALADMGGAISVMSTRIVPYAIVGCYWPTLVVVLAPYARLAWGGPDALRSHVSPHA